MIYQEVLPALNKAIKLRGVVSALLALSCLTFIGQTQDALAQRLPTRTPAPAAPPSNRAPASRTTTPATRQPATKSAPASRAASARGAAVSGGVPHFTHTFRANWSQVPSSVTRRRYVKGKTSKAIGDSNATRQTVLTTYTYLQPGATGSDGVTNNSSSPLARPNLPSTAPNYQPNWSADERYIYFTSRRNGAQDTTLNASGIYSIYQTLPDGSGITQISPGTENQIEPNIASDGFRLAYAGGGTISVNGAGVPVNTNGQANGQFATNGFKLYYVNIRTNVVTPLSERNPQGIGFLDIRHPSWSPGGNQIAFAAKTSVDPTHYHIYKVNTDTGNITQLTSGVTTDETAPAWSPDGSVIAITTNATAFSVGGGGAALASVSAKSTTDIWVINQNLFTPDSTQVTNSASVPNSVATNNRNAAWSTLRTDVRGFVPSSATSSQQLLAFASDRAPIATTVAGVTTISWGLSTNGSTDIYFLQATVAQDPANINGAFTVTTPESGAPGSTGGNPALALTTSSSDLLTNGMGHNSDPTNTPEYAASFDPSRVTSEDYPTWPQYINSYRITFQSNSNGQGAITPTVNIWASTILDINAPTLIKYDIQNNQVVGVFHDSPAPPAPGLDTNSYAREFAAGETVRFRVKVADYESGVAAVFLQIKCPDSAQQSSDNAEHKWYFDGAAVTVLPNGPPFSALDANTATGMVGSNGTPIELEAQAINANILDPGFGTFPQTLGATVINAGIPPPNAFLGVNGPSAFGAIPATFPGTNDFLASYDDDAAFSGAGVLSAFTPGSAAPATVNYWLPLHDNGPDPNPAHTTLASQAGNEPRGEISNDGIWSGSWQTPANFPSDWIVDVIVFDRAVDPFSTNTPPDSNNWKIYDNVWGLTTKPFQVDPRTTLLYVNDYDEGQKFFDTFTGTFTGFNNRTVGPIGIPTESWMTEFDPTILPSAWWKWPIPPAPGGLLLLTLNTLGINSYGSFTAPNDPLAGYQPASIAIEGRDNDGSVIPPTQRYAQWRILCRGPVPDSVLNAFAPRQETQPADVFTVGSQPRTVTVAERCVVWHSPYTGDLMVGSGTILDRAVQNQLTNFVAQGGRLFLSGQDVAFGLTNGNAAAGASAFLENIFHVRYASDQGANRTVTLPATALPNVHPIGTQTFVNGPQHYYPGSGSTFNPPSAAGTISLNAYSYGDNALRGGSNLAACPNPYLLNTLTATMAEQPGVFGIDGYYGSTASPNIVWYTNAANGSKVIFSSLPWEAISPGYFTAASPPNRQMPMNTQTDALNNRLTELMHNALDYLRTGRIVGTIRSVNSGGGGGGIGNGGQGLSNVFVRAVGVDATGAAVVTGTTVTQADGSYVIDGLDPTGIYNIDATAAGFIAGHVAGDYFHGGYQIQIDAYLTPALPANINGTVVVKASGAKVPGAIVTATDPVTGAKFSATTDINGAFSITNVPAIYNPTNPNSNLGYIVRVTNLAALGYGSSTPYSYGLFSTETQANFPDAQPAVQVGNPTSPNVTLVPAGQPAGSPSFSLIATPGTLTGLVTDSVSGAGIVGATVTLTSGAFSATATTTAGGAYSFTNLAPGSYQATVTASGYAASASTPIIVVSGVNPAQNFTLTLANPGALVVTVTDGTNPIGGATVTLQTTAGATLTFVGGGAIAAPVESPTGTYTFASVPAGSVQIVVSKPGYKAADANPKTVTVTSTPTGGTATPATASFILIPKATFDAGLTMISTPQDYSTLSPAPSIFTLLGSAVELFTWNPARGAYDSNPPKNGASIGLTDTLHRGRGYFLYAASGAVLTTEGSPTDESSTAPPFDVTLQTGWNMIGDPYSFPVDFSQLSIVRPDNSTALTSASTDISNALFTYLGNGYTLSTTVDAYRGYWLYAFSPVRLRFTTSAKVTRAISRTPGNNSGEWRINLVAQAGDQHQATGYLGVSRAASDGFDNNKALAPPTMGAENVTLTFDHSDWGNQSGHYAVDVRSVGLTSQTWNFTVNSSVANTPVTLHWPSIATIPGKQSIVLTDLDSNHTMNLRSQNSYVIPASDKPVTRHFSLQMTRAGKLKLQVSDLVAHNSGGGNGRAAGVVVSYRISSEADVQVNILRNGQRIRTLTSSVHRAAGVTDTPWDMRDDKGVAVAGDTYTVEVRATDADGNVARRVSPLLVTR